MPISRTGITTGFLCGMAFDYLQEQLLLLSEILVKEINNKIPSLVNDL
jgi:hypothetical protein